MKCLLCNSFKHSRGLCIKHATRLRKRVLDGELTYAEAEARGECLAPKPSPWNRLYQETRRGRQHL